MKAALLMLVACCVAGITCAQTGAIRGTVSSSDGKPAVAVTVHLKNTQQSTMTGEDGTFVLRNVSPGSQEIEVSLVGYEPVSKTVTVESGRTAHIRLQLEVSQRQLQEVVVTGGQNKFYTGSSDNMAKMPLKNLENPQVYHVVNSALIREQMITNFDDVLRNVPGVTKLFTGGGDFQTDYSLRGFPTEANLRNGISAFNTTDLDPANIEKLEVLKGPSGTLFGSTLVSWGGLINRVTKQPYGHFGGEVSYTGGSYDLSRFTADVNAPLTKDSTVLFRINAAHTYKGSFMDYGFTKSTFLAPALSYRPNDRLDISLEAEFYKREGTSYPSFFIFQPMDAASAKDLNLDYKRSFTNNEVTFLSPVTNVFGQVKYKISDHWTSQTAASTSHGINNGYYQWDNFLSGAADSLVRTITDWRNNVTVTTEIQQNFISDYSWGKMRNRLVAGIDFYNYHGTGTYYYITYDTVNVSNPGAAYLDITPSRIEEKKASGAVGPNASNDNTQYVYAAYVSDVFNLTDNLIFNAALRVDRFDNKGTLDPVTMKSSDGYAQTTLSPKFGIVYQPLKDKIALFANYSNGFQNNSGVDFSGKAFKPSNGNQLEAGVKLDAWEHKLSATVSYFNIHAADLLVTDPSHPGFSVQNGKQTTKGLEASVMAAPVAGLNLMAGYAYTDKRWNGAGDNSGVPANTVNFYASYHLSGPVQGLGIGFGGNYGDKYQPAPGYGITFPSYTILDASVFYDKPHYRIGLKMDNLTNEHYWIGWFDMEPQMLRNISVTLSLKF